MKVDYVVLGGGVAGLCAARRLIELGIRPLVIEAGSYPSHKVCGEFFSPSSLPILKRWDIDLCPLYQACLHTSTHRFEFSFPSPAGALSHMTFDTQLAHQISQLGATLLTNTKVESLIPSSIGEDHHILHLSSGEKLAANHLLIATGRLSYHSKQAPRLCYAGFKSHFSGIKLESRIEMFSFPGAYLGLAPIENGRTNLACITTIENYNKCASSSKQFMQSLIDSHPYLNHLLASSSNLLDGWMEAIIPEFGLRSPPDWPRTYWIGDAAGTIPPASGNGLSLALASGFLAAEYASRKDPAGFKKAWRKRCASQILFGKGLHQLFMHPVLGNWAIRASSWFPSLAQHLFALTRE